MKEIKEEVKREVVDTHIYYEAFDGTQFTQKTECEKYENCALGAVLKRIQTFIIASDNGGDMINPFDESDENLFMCVVPKTQSDIDTLNHLFAFRGMKASEVPFTDKYIDVPLLIGYRLCDYTTLDWCWYYNLNEVINKMTGGTLKLVENNEK